MFVTQNLIFSFSNFRSTHIDDFKKAFRDVHIQTLQVREL